MKGTVYVRQIFTGDLQIALVHAGHPNFIEPEIFAETEANARLIAAAPELLEACERVLVAHISANTKGEVVTDPYGEILKQAIAKAEGEK